MNIYQKLNAAREQFHQVKMEKSGKNTFAKYDYFTLSDFIKPALKVMSDNGLCATVSFDALIATMTIVNIQKMDEVITLTSPMGSALLKGCHEVQNIGAVETYQRRYLWVAALEIIEQDALDSTTERDKTKAPIIPASPKTEELGITAERLAIIQLVAENIKEHFAKGNIIDAYGEKIGITDGDESIALNNLLPSNIRSALRNHHQSLKKA
jgi:hypothetical protein